ncbi:retinol dehydrogenase 16-like [Mytilus edulis]|uniref:retinol dehydrogenase 16-like n=1 Tax=Mytilus edulis TaxID=6550 RepID=UPI0039EFE721
MMCGILILFIVVTILLKIAELYLRTLRLRNVLQKHVLITGCDSGFGNSLAKYLDGIGVPVFAACLTESGQKNLKARCSSRLKTLKLDVTDEKSIGEAVQFVQSKLEKGQDLWGLVNNAGLQVISAPLELHSKSAIEKTLQVNLLGAMYVTKAFLPLLRQSKGRIVSVSSDAALIAWPCRVAYNISKCGVESMSSCLRKEMYHVGVSAHCVEPGAFKTNIVYPDEMASQLQQAYNASDKEIRTFYGPNWLEKWKETYKNILPIQNPDLSPVTDAIEHAIFAKFPKARYRCGRDCQYEFWPMSLLPDWFSDWYYAMPAPDGAK